MGALVAFCASFSSPSGLEGREGFLPCWDNSSSDCCEETNRWWLDAEYLYWTLKDSPEHVPLVIEGTVPGGNVVLGGKKIDTKWRSGGSFTLGYWFDDSKCLGGEISYMFLPDATKTKSVFSDASSTSSFLSVPFFNVQTGAENTIQIAFPGVYSGRAKLKLKNSMQSAEMNVVATLPYDCEWSFGLLAGFRYWNFNERLTFDTDSPFIPPFTADVYMTKDSFHTKNNFYGGQIGGWIDYHCNQFFCRLKGKIALGAMHQESVIKGELLTNDFNGFGTVQTFPGGYFALPSNIGHHKSNCFAVIPEANITFGYEVTDVLRLQVGYTFLYVNNVLWAGKQISRNISPSQAISYTSTPVLVGEASPKGSLKSGNFWAQGINVGLEFDF